MTKVGYIEGVDAATIPYGLINDLTVRKAIGRIAAIEIGISPVEVLDGGDVEDHRGIRKYTGRFKYPDSSS